MSQPDDSDAIEFWFDFSSGYAFFAAMDIEALAERVGRKTIWHPFMLGAAFKLTGARGLSSTPLKAEYAHRDWERIAALREVKFQLPSEHPLTALAATRAFYWIEDTQGLETSVRFCLRVFEQYYSVGLDTNSEDAVANLAAELGIRKDEVLRGISTPRIKALARSHCDDAISRGVFGSPFFFVGGESFWGWDRMPMMENWINRNGW